MRPPLLPFLSRGSAVRSQPQPPWRERLPVRPPAARRCAPSSSSSSSSRSGTTRLSSSPGGGGGGNGLRNTLGSRLDWNDRIGLQNLFTLEEKGWTVEVDWRPTPYGAGLFAGEDVAAGTVLRRGVLGVNLIEFATMDDVDDFCRRGSAGRGEDGVDDDDDDGDGYKARVGYVKDYMWGFPKKADERGYCLPDYCDSGEKDWFFGMWIPGNGLNHDTDPNTVYVASPDGIDLVALAEIRADDELTDDYRRHGKPPPWGDAFATAHGVTLNFAGWNDFV